MVLIKGVLIPFVISAIFYKQISTQKIDFKKIFKTPKRDYDKLEILERSSFEPDDHIEEKKPLKEETNHHHSHPKAFANAQVLLNFDHNNLHKDKPNSNQNSRCKCQCCHPPTSHYPLNPFALYNPYFYHPYNPGCFCVPPFFGNAPNKDGYGNIGCGCGCSNHGNYPWPNSNPFPQVSPNDDEDEAKKPTVEPTDESTQKPFVKPTQKLTEKPTERPTEKPTERSTWKPLERPTRKPSYWSTHNPTRRPTDKPTSWPTYKTTEIITKKPTSKPSERPTRKPTHWSTRYPTGRPTDKPTSWPTYKTTEGTTTKGSSGPSFYFPTEATTTLKPTKSTPQDVEKPKKGPSFCWLTDKHGPRPTFPPTNEPTQKPTEKPTGKPKPWTTSKPTESTLPPTQRPTKNPPSFPLTLKPTPPTQEPTNKPIATDKPFVSPSFRPIWTPIYPSCNPFQINFPQLQKSSSDLLKIRSLVLRELLIVVENVLRYLIEGNDKCTIHFEVEEKKQIANAILKMVDNLKRNNYHIDENYKRWDKSGLLDKILGVFPFNLLLQKFENCKNVEKEVILKHIEEKYSGTAGHKHLEQKLKDKIVDLFLDNFKIPPEAIRAANQKDELTEIIEDILTRKDDVAKNHDDMAILFMNLMKEIQFPTEFTIKPKSDCDLIDALVKGIFSAQKEPTQKWDLPENTLRKFQSVFMCIFAGRCQERYPNVKGLEKLMVFCKGDLNRVKWNLGNGSGFGMLTSDEAGFPIGCPKCCLGLSNGKFPIDVDSLIMENSESANNHNVSSCGNNCGCSRYTKELNDF